MRNININPNKTFQAYPTKHISSSIHLSLVTKNEVNKLLKSLRTKTSSGHGGISVKLLKFLFRARIRPLIIIMNQSLITGIFPEQLRIGKVIPLHKKTTKWSWAITDLYLCCRQFQNYLKKWHIINYMPISQGINNSMKGNTDLKK